MLTPAWARPVERREQLDPAHREAGVTSWIWDVTLGRMEWFGNPDALLGIAPGAFSGRYEDYLERLHPDDALAAKCTFVEGLKGLRPHYRAEERLLWPDGSVHWLETFGHAEHSDGCAVRMAGVLRDITERRRAEERIRDLEAFSLAVSHDLHAPVRTIAGFAELLREDCGSMLNVEGRQHLERIRVAAKNMGEMIEGLLALSTSGRRELAFDAVSVGALATELIGYLRPACGFTGEACVGELPAAHGDARLIRQVLQNLLANAMKFTTPAACSACSSASTRKRSTRVRGSASPPCAASSSVTAARCAPRACPAAAPRSTSRCARLNPSSAGA